MKVTVYGHNDDLIEIEGAIEDEFPAFTRDDDDKPNYLAFSDGSVLSVGMDGDGFWRIHLLEPGSADFWKTEATDIETDHSDRVTLIGDVHWVVFGCTLAKAK